MRRYEQQALKRDTLQSPNDRLRLSGGTIVFGLKMMSPSRVPARKWHLYHS
jgi:hypothetical protein